MRAGCSPTCVLCSIIRRAQVALLSCEAVRHGETARAQRETALAVHSGAKQHARRVGEAARAELEAGLAAAQAAAARERERAEVAEAHALSEGDARAQAQRGVALARLQAEEAARRGAEADRRVAQTEAVSPRVLRFEAEAAQRPLSHSELARVRAELNVTAAALTEARRAALSCHPTAPYQHAHPSPSPYTLPAQPNRLPYTPTGASGA